MKKNRLGIRYPRRRLRALLPVLVLSCLFVTATMYGDEASARGNEGPAVYIAGYESDGSTSTPCYWLNDEQYTLPVTGSGGCARAVAVSPSGVYIMGYESDGWIQTPCYWLNGVKYTLPVTAGSNGYAQAIAVSGSDVYVAGNESDGDTATPCYWLNGVKYTLPVTGLDGSRYRRIPFRCVCRGFRT
jgi:hypothetical protein